MSRIPSGFHHNMAGGYREMFGEATLVEGPPPSQQPWFKAMNNANHFNKLSGNPNDHLTGIPSNSLSGITSSNGGFHAGMDSANLGSNLGYLSLMSSLGGLNLPSEIEAQIMGPATSGMMYPRNIG